MIGKFENDIEFRRFNNNRMITNDRYLEDLGTMTGHMTQIKLIEGLVVAAETLGGEVVFFSLSGKSLSLCCFHLFFTRII